MQKRALTINFERSVGSAPVVMEVAVRPLKTPNAPDLDATLAALADSRDVVLNGSDVAVVFDLVPTDHPELTDRLFYRVAWREKYMGRQYTSDIVMPDFDVDFDDLGDLGNIIGGETYVQWTDVSRPGGVAALNTQGQVIDSEGNVVSGAESAATVQGHLDAEVVARLQGDVNVRSLLLAQLSDQITQVYATAAQNLSAAVAQLQNTDTTEKAQRIAAVNAANASITALQNATNTSIALINDTLDDIDGELGFKADLVGGKVPSDQLPEIALGHAVSVANQAEMLGLDDVQPGDFAVRPDSIWFLNAVPASVLANWVQFQVAATVTSVNGQTGAVVLSAANVGARSSSVGVPLADVTGLTTALNGKADTSTTTGLNDRLVAIEDDDTLVRTTSGLIAKALMPADSAFINGSDLLVKKDGSVILTGGGGALDIADVDGLQEALDAKLDADHVSVTNARTPTAHKISHATGGSDVLTPGDIGAALASHIHPQSAITDLEVDQETQNDRLDSVEQQLLDLEPGGGGGGGTAKSVWWNSGGLTTDFDTVMMRSPFGYDGSDYYYNPAGADSGEVVWPYLTPNGHLKFITRNESAAADLDLATQDALDALTTIVNLKADDADLATANLAIAGKASLAALSTLQAEVDGKATTVALNSLGDTVATKASQSAVDTLSTAVALKASQAALDALTTTVSGKASTASVTTLSDSVSLLQTGKADLTAGKVPVSQIPTGIPAANITGIEATLTNKADLVSGIVPLAQLPSYPTSKVSGLDATLGAKADLVAGKVPNTQLPSLAFGTAVSVANKSAMLALTSGQVQPGDIAVITATVDKGSYILSADDPSVFGNWVKLVAPDDAVQSVNGLSGTVVLDAAAVGARPSNVNISQAEIVGLTVSLAAKADAAATTTALAGKTAPADVQALLTESVANKQKADYAATSAVTTLSGQQSVDGTLVPLGSIVLLTAQASSVNNGLYTVNSGAWTRVTDMAAGSYFLRGSQAIVANGSNHANTFWNQTSNSGVVGTNANNWTKVMTAGAAPVYTASNGVKKTGLDFSLDPVTGGGIIVTGGKAALDPTVATRKYAADVPAGSAIVTITHNLNSLDVQAQFRDKSAGDAVLLGWKPTGVNTISAEFELAPTAGQWRVVVMG